MEGPHLADIRVFNRPSVSEIPAIAGSLSPSAGDIGAVTSIPNARGRVPDGAVTAGPTPGLTMVARRGRSGDFSTIVGGHAARESLRPAEGP